MNQPHLYASGIVLVFKKKSQHYQKLFTWRKNNTTTLTEEKNKQMAKHFLKAAISVIVIVQESDSCQLQSLHLQHNFATMYSNIFVWKMQNNAAELSIQWGWELSSLCIAKIRVSSSMMRSK